MVHLLMFVRILMNATSVQRYDFIESLRAISYNLLIMGYKL